MAGVDLAFQARHARKQADALDAAIAGARRSITDAAWAGPTCLEAAHAHATKLCREQQLWRQIAEEIETYLADAGDRAQDQALIPQLDAGEPAT